MLSVFQVELRHPILNSIKGALFPLPEKEKEPKKKGEQSSADSTNWSRITANDR